MVMNVVSGRRSPTLIVMGLSSRADARVLGLDGAPTLRARAVQAKGVPTISADGCSLVCQASPRRDALGANPAGAAREGRRYLPARSGRWKMQNHRRLI